MNPQNKFLVRLLSELTQKQIFFLFWFALVATFALLIYNQYRKATRRQFRTARDGMARPIRVDARRLSDATTAIRVVGDQEKSKKE